MDIREQNMRLVMRQRIQEAIDAARAGRFAAIDFSGQSHNTIADALHEFVYVNEDEQPAPVSVHVLYGDSSRGKPFPLQCLRRRYNGYAPLLRSVPPLRVALISMRHLEMDSLVDMAWLLNKDLPKAPPLAEVDHFSYRTTKRQLQEALRYGPLKIHLYHTGFQPAVVGFYRALVEELLARQNQPPVLEVTPYYFWHIMNCYHPGRLTWN